MADGHGGFEAFEAFGGEELFDEALQEVGAALNQRLRGGVAFQEGDDAGGDVFGVDVV